MDVRGRGPCSSAGKRGLGSGSWSSWGGGTRRPGHWRRHEGSNLGNWAAVVSQTGPRRGRRGQGALLDMSDGLLPRLQAPWWQLELLQAGEESASSEWVRGGGVGVVEMAKGESGEGQGRPSKIEPGAGMCREVDGQAQPAREAGCTFELWPLLARQPWESILLVGVLGRAGGPV